MLRPKRGGENESEPLGTLSMDILQYLLDRCGFQGSQGRTSRTIVNLDGCSVRVERAVSKGPTKKRSRIWCVKLQVIVHRLGNETKVRQAQDLRPEKRRANKR